jgi:hypothetical protein
MKRIAACQCGGFRVVVVGDPTVVNICHCTECQRRSGAPPTSNAYFRNADVHLEGQYKIYSRVAVGRTVSGAQRRSTAPLCEAVVSQRLGRREESACLEAAPCDRHAVCSVD